MEKFFVALGGNWHQIKDIPENLKTLEEKIEWIKKEYKHPQLRISIILEK